MLGWVSVIGLIYLNMKGLPDQIEGFFGDNPTASQITLADNIAYVIIAPRHPLVSLDGCGII